MKRLLAAVLVLGALLGYSASPAKAAAGGRVLLVSYPGLQWDDVLEHRPPALLGLLERSAVASMSVRAIGPVTSLGEAYTTIGAGNRANAEDVMAGQAYSPLATVEGDAAADVFARRCGCSANDAAVLHLGMPRVIRSNERLLYGAEPGALGAAITRAGGVTAVVANADRTIGAVGDSVHREASLGVVDDLGRVGLGEVGESLVTEDTAAPFGLRMAIDAAAEAARAAWRDADLLLVEMSDLDRVDRYADLASSAATAAARAAAIERSDELLASLLDDVDPERDLVIVVGPVGPRGPAELTVAAIAGPGIETGRARSATTRRDGFVTLPDIAPTVLDFLEIDIPDSMNGTGIVSSGGAAPELSDLRTMADENELAVFRDGVTGPASVTFIVVQVVAYALAALALTRFRRTRRWVSVLLLVPLAQTSLAFLSRFVAYDVLGEVGYVVALFLAGLAVAFAADSIGRALEPRVGPGAVLLPPLLLVSLTLVVLVVDIALGGRLQLNTVFGYSPTVAGRFAGFGNLAFALLASTSILAVTGWWALRSLRGRAPSRAALAAAGSALALVVVVDGAPSLGSDVGGVLALVPAGAVVVLLLAGVRLSWARVLLIAAGTAAVLVTFALVDLARPEESRTHLGRLAAKVLDADDGGVTTVLRRKLESNIGILTSSVWTWVIPIALAFLTFLVWRRPGSLRSVEERFPGLRAGLIGALVAGVIGFLLNDSGIAVPAMMLAVVLPHVAYLIVRTAD